jgi:cytochrome o ubiquinol oxidase subunit 1
MGFLIGLMNLIVPLQIGARDLAFPFLNSLGFWLYVAGAILINMFFVFGGQFASAGWLSLPPLSEIAYSPGTACRLLDMELADFRTRQFARRSQLSS